jgi:hypothetical protein
MKIKKEAFYLLVPIFGLFIGDKNRYDTIVAETKEHQRIAYFTVIDSVSKDRSSYRLWANTNGLKFYEENTSLSINDSDILSGKIAVGDSIRKEANSLDVEIQSDYEGTVLKTWRLYKHRSVDEVIGRLFPAVFY